MKILLSSTAVLVLVLGLSGTAFADPNANSLTTGNPDKGNQGCQLVSGEQYKTMGHVFRAVRAGTADTDANPGSNPKDSVNQFPDVFSNVGDAVHFVCGKEMPS